jgi:hypothetical protein
MDKSKSITACLNLNRVARNLQLLSFQQNRQEKALPGYTGKVWWSSESLVPCLDGN